jgi:histidinol-phosphate aminotransferase
VSWYVREVLAARKFFTAELDRLRIPYWPSQANFVLTRIGAKHAEFSIAMHNRGVLVRDRSSDPGCDGCVRITIGTREQMETSVAALAESLAEIGWTGDEA